MKLTSSYSVVRVAKEFNLLDLQRGKRLEGEHDLDPDAAEDTAKENLVKDPHHYENLIRMQN